MLNKVIIHEVLTILLIGHERIINTISLKNNGKVSPAFLLSTSKHPNTSQTKDTHNFSTHWSQRKEDRDCQRSLFHRDDPDAVINRTY